MELNQTYNSKKLRRVKHKMVRRKKIKKTRMAHFAIDLDVLNRLRNLKKEKGIKSINYFIREAVNEKLNPSALSSDELEKLRNKLSKLEDESKYYYKKRLIGNYTDFLKGKLERGINEDDKNNPLIYPIPVIGWAMAIFNFSIYYPLEYLFKHKQYLYIKTEKLIEMEDKY